MYHDDERWLKFCACHRWLLFIRWQVAQSSELFRIIIPEDRYGTFSIYLFLAGELLFLNFTILIFPTMQNHYLNFFPAQHFLRDLCIPIFVSHYARVDRGHKTDPPGQMLNHLTSIVTVLQVCKKKKKNPQKQKWKKKTPC